MAAGDGTSFFSRVKRLTQMVFGRGDRNNWLFFTPGQRRYVHKVGDGSSSSVVMAPLLWIARNFPEAPPAMWKKLPDSGEEERVTGMGDQGGDHLMLELMERPNLYYSGSLLWMATLLDWHLSGDAYWLKFRDTVGRPIELWWTPSALITPVGDEKTFIDHYEYKINGETHDIDPSEVVHFRYGLDPENPRKGRSPLSALLHEVFTDAEAANFTATILSNMGVPGVVVSPSTNAQPTSEDVKATKAYMKEGFTGERRGEPLVMSGPTNVSQFGFSPEQMTLREIRRIPEERVSAAVGVPAIVAGLGAGLDRSTFANYAEAREAAYQDNIIPTQRLLAEEVRFQLLPDFQPDDFRAYRFGFDLSNVRVLQEDRNQLATRYDIGVRGGWIRVGEARRAMDLEVDDADDIYLRGVAVIEIPAGEAAPAPVPAELSPGQEPGQPALPATTAQLRSLKLSRVQTHLQHALLQVSHLLSAQLARELNADFAAFGLDCSETYLQVTNQSSNGHERAVKAMSAEQLARLIAATLAPAFGEKMKERFQRHAARTLTETVTTIAAVANLSGGVSDPVQRQIIEAGGKRVGMLDIDKSTRESLFRVINEGNQNGLNPREIARNIRDEVPAGPFRNAGPAYRSQLIARTETNWAMNTSALSMYRESDEVNMVVAMDGSDDPECAERNGKEFTVDEAEAELENEHPNGTLTFAPIIGSQEGVPA
jgi:HK97 family phage portal protein